jgi:hypothetical protein
VRCPDHPALEGTYTQVDKSRRYVKQGTYYALAQQGTGEWGVTDGVAYVLLADKQASAPDECKQWKLLCEDKSYKRCTAASVTRFEGTPAAPAPSAALAPCYRVRIPQEPALEGLYARTGTADRYLQQGVGAGAVAHVLVQHNTGQWGIGDGKIYLLLAKNRSAKPDDNVVWQMLHDMVRYRDCKSVLIQRHDEPLPDAATKPAQQGKTCESVVFVCDPAFVLCR